MSRFSLPVFMFSYIFLECTWRMPATLNRLWANTTIQNAVWTFPRLHTRLQVCQTPS